MSADLKPDTRAEFEAWKRDTGWADCIAAGICSPGSPCEGEYRHHGLQDDWEVWQAATSAAQAKIAALEAELAAAQAQVAAMRDAGAPMANTMFNLAQREHWPAFERESFKAMQVAWDSASSAAGEATNG